jgi:hypothetical protein
MKPPSVYELTTPKIHRSSNTTNSVHSMFMSRVGRSCAPGRKPARRTPPDHTVRTAEWSTGRAKGRDCVCGEQNAVFAQAAGKSCIPLRAHPAANLIDSRRDHLG